MARDQALIAWPEGNELPPSKNSPLLWSTGGRCLWEAVFNALTTMALSMSASALSKPVSRARALCVARPTK